MGSIYIVKGEVTDAEGYPDAKLGDVEWQFSDGPVGERGSSSDYTCLHKGIADHPGALLHMEYDDWIEAFQPVKNHLDDNASHEGTMFETYGKEREHIVAMMGDSAPFVWTLVEGDNGEWIIVSGYHWVNRLGYFITDVPFDGDMMEVMVFDTDEEEEALG